MSNARINQIQKVSSIGNDDVFVINQKNGEDYATKSVKFSDIKSSLNLDNQNFAKQYQLGSFELGTSTNDSDYRKKPYIFFAKTIIEPYVKNENGEYIKDENGEYVRKEGYTIYRNDNVNSVLWNNIYGTATLLLTSAGERTSAGSPQNTYLLTLNERPIWENNPSRIYVTKIAGHDRNVDNAVKIGYITLLQDTTLDLWISDTSKQTIQAYMGQTLYFLSLDKSIASYSGVNDVTVLGSSINCGPFGRLDELPGEDICVKGDCEIRSVDLNISSVYNDTENASTIKIAQIENNELFIPVLNKDQNGIVPKPGNTSDYGKFLKINNDGNPTWAIPPDTNTTYKVFTDSSLTAGTGLGLVKKPTDANKNNFLKGDGSWVNIGNVQSRIIYFNPINGDTGTYTTSRNSKATVYGDNTVEINGTISMNDSKRAVILPVNLSDGYHVVLSVNQPTNSEDATIINAVSFQHHTDMFIIKISQNTTCNVSFNIKGTLDTGNESQIVDIYNMTSQSISKVFRITESGDYNIILVSSGSTACGYSAS